ncbi:MAG TPA: MIP family channel protein [Rubrobacteraceae bacterium]|nr:MIP family channel protein [Rubrobacteraceae bacterium]
MSAVSTPARGGWRSTIWGELSAEFLGTFVLIAFGNGVVAMTVAALNQSGRGKEIFAASGDWLLIAFGWALAVTFAVYVAGGISGAHINPAVTLAFAVKRGFPWSKVPGYMAAQMVGAFAGAALVYLNYHNAIASFENAKNITRGAADSTATFSIFATFPAPYFNGSNIGPLIDQIIGTAFLVLIVFALVDVLNQPPKSNMAPLLVGLAVAAIGMSFGANAGYAINPARDLGPRVFAWLAGWGDVALPGVNYYFWVPIVGPLIGGVVGAFVYDLFIRDVLTARGEHAEPDVEPRGRTVEEEVGAGNGTREPAAQG